MLTYVAGDPLDHQRTASLLLFTSRDGISRRGLALRARKTYPAWHGRYLAACTTSWPPLKVGATHAYTIGLDRWIVALLVRERFSDPVDPDLLRACLGRLGPLADELGIRVMAVEGCDELDVLGADAVKCLEHIPSVHGEINVRYYRRPIGVQQPSFAAGAMALSRR